MNLTKDTTTENVVLSLLEKTTLGSPIYLIEFRSDSTNEKNTCIITDKSLPGAARQRANLFDITEGTDDRLNGSLVLFNVGRYHYIVREQESTTNLDPSLSGKVVQRGIMVLLDSESSNYVEHEINVIYKVHEPV